MVNLITGEILYGNPTTVSRGFMNHMGTFVHKEAV
jgi:hypothetical protein